MRLMYNSYQFTPMGHKNKPKDYDQFVGEGTTADVAKSMLSGRPVVSDTEAGKWLKAFGHAT